MSEYVIGITGASGSIYGVRLLRELASRGYHVNVVVSRAGKLVMQKELGVMDMAHMETFGLADFAGRISVWENEDFSALFMSGSNAPKAVILVPCSMGTLSAVAHGSSGNLIERAADVALKEKRPLILVVRETPFNLIHLENMVTAAKAGADILPAMPAFYHHPKTIDDMVDFVVGKILGLLRIEHKLFNAWGAE